VVVVSGDELHTATSGENALQWVRKYGGELLRVGDVEFRLIRLAAGPPATSTSFQVRKGRWMVERLAAIVRALRPARIVELGIAGGGSTAFFSQLLRPHKLVAIELDPDRVVALDEYIADHGLEESVRPYYGINQGDRDAVGAIVAEEFGSEPIDLVIDDASHRLAETTASFELLFPRLRPGGMYIIEDWNWAAHDYPVDGPPLTDLVLELVGSCVRDGIIERLIVEPAYCQIVRSAAPGTSMPSLSSGTATA
jgi:hypothetical protein